MQPTLLDRIAEQEGDLVLQPSGVRLAKLLDPLQAGRSLQEVASSLKLEAADVIAALAYAALGSEEDLGPPLVHSESRLPGLADALTERSLSRLLPGSSQPARLALSAGLLQMHDFWDESHHAAQEADDLGEDSVSAYWHGIAHRREPDPGNAAYWFRRVGRHPVFRILEVVARPIVEEYGSPAVMSRLLGEGSWNPFALIDLCSTAQPGTPIERLARRIQRLEMEALLGVTAAGVGVAL